MKPLRFGCERDRIAVKFDKNIGNIIAKTPVKLYSDISVLGGFWDFKKSRGNTSKRLENKNPEDSFPQTETQTGRLNEIADSFPM